MTQTRPSKFIVAEFDNEIEKWDELFEFHGRLGFPVPDDANKIYDGLVKARDRLIADNINEGKAL